MQFRISFFLFGLVALLGCSEEEPSMTGCFPTPCDTCDNYYVFSVDSVGMIPQLRVFTMQTWLTSLSTDASILAFQGIRKRPYGDAEPKYTSGLSFLNLYSGKVIHYIEDDFVSYDWRPGYPVLTYLTPGFSVLREYNVSTGVTMEYPELGLFERVSYSQSGKYMYLTGRRAGRAEYAILRWDHKSDSLEYIASDKRFTQRYIVVNDSMLISLIPSRSGLDGEQGVYWLNANTKTISKVEDPVFDERFDITKIRESLSPDGTKIIFDVGVFFDAKKGYSRGQVWMLDLSNYTLRQVMGYHDNMLWGSRYPVWASNSSFYASWYCAKDSSFTLWEYNLNGEPIQQLTYWHTRFWEAQ